MNTQEEWEKKIEEELSFLSKDGYTFGWQEMTKNGVKEVIREAIQDAIRKDRWIVLNMIERYRCGHHKKLKEYLRQETLINKK